ncbi:MAG: hypothetical protein ABIJ05_04550 [Patescibacteria group bacterium]
MVDISMVEQEQKKAPPHYVITAKEFFDEDYADKIKKGSCIAGILVGEPKREDYDSEQEYKSNLYAFEMTLKMNPTGNLHTFEVCERKGDNYLLTHFDRSGGKGTMAMAGETKMLVFPKQIKIESNSK